MNIVETSYSPQIIIDSIKKKKKVFVFIYMETCPHCIVVQPEWDKLEKEIKRSYPNAKFIITKVERKYMDNLKQYLGDINTYPTFLSLQGNKKTKYEGKRDYASLLSWIKKDSKTYTKGGRKRRRVRRKTRKN